MRLSRKQSKPDRKTVVEVLRREIPADPVGVVAAWLFGSVARDEARADSDVDVGIFLGHPPEPGLAGYCFGLADRLELALGREVQVVVLDDAPADLIHRVFRDGILLLDRDPVARIRFEVAKRNEWLDLAPLRRLCRYPEGGRT